MFSRSGCTRSDILNCLTPLDLRIRLNATTALKVINSFDIPAAAVWNVFTHLYYFFSMEIDQTSETVYCCPEFISSVVRNT
jgi:hypothetical protein